MILSTKGHKKCIFNVVLTVSKLLYKVHSLYLKATCIAFLLLGIYSIVVIYSNKKYTFQSMFSLLMFLLSMASYVCIYNVYLLSQ